MSAVTLLLRHLPRASKSASKGFTLIELLVTIILASGIVSGLMYLAIEVLKTDQRESDRTETQRDMQLALTYMESELKQAVFAYDADCLDGTAADCEGSGGWNLNLPAGMTPILAFWRLQPIPQAVQSTACTADPPPTNLPCLAGSSYSLVVYSLGARDDGPDDPDNPLTAIVGEAGIFRSDMSIADAAATGYVSPFESGSANFKNWPPDGSTPAFSEPELLADFVDDGNGSLAAGVDPSCPTVTGSTYQLTPSGAVPRSFYACISEPGTTAGNQEVVLSLRGNAVQRSGLMREDTFLPPIETRVFIRGTLDKTPS